ADVIIRSPDHVDFRVHKSILATSSPDMFSLAQPSNNEAVDGLPIVQLSDDAELVRALITALYPIPFETPASYDRTLALLAAAQKYDMVAQKYEMNSVLTHIRGSLALQDPPFIRPENAFLAYSVAQRYGLRKEATQAARLTLKFTLTIERPELEVVPGAYLYELWNYHKTVRAQFSHHSWSRAATVNSQSHIGLSATHLPLPECLDTGEADIIVRTSDLANFLVHKSVLASSSSVFRDMFALPGPSSDGMIDGLPVVDISEDSELVRSLITIMYPVPSEIPASYDKILALLAAAQKYEMDAVQSTIRAEIARGPSHTLYGVEVFRAYAIASSSGLRPEMEMVAYLTLDQPMTFKHLGTELRSFEGRALRELVSFREQCRDNLVS
ncbi:hypothetical protein EDB83DRAFT_2210011, partial [Lactarius deliciosus]